MIELQSARLRSRLGAVRGDGFPQVFQFFARQQADLAQGREMFLGVGDIAGQQTSLADIFVCATMTRVFRQLYTHTPVTMRTPPMVLP